MVTGIENYKNDFAHPRQPPTFLRFSRKYKEILSFLVSLGSGATMPQFFELFEIPPPISLNEYVKMDSTLAHMVGCGLLERVPAPWHNGTTWRLTELGASHGRRILEEIQKTIEASRRREKLLQMDITQPRPQGGRLPPKTSTT